MVTIINCHERQSKDEKTFISLELLGSVELTQSLETGKFYATARKAFITSTFDHQTAKGLIGTKLPGTIKRVEADAYDYTIPETGEVIKLAHKYEYQPETFPSSSIPDKQFSLKSSPVIA